VTSIAEPRKLYREKQTNPPPQPGGFLLRRVFAAVCGSRRQPAAGYGEDRRMSLSSAKNYALRAARSQDEKEAIELLSKAILELATSIEATDAKLKRMNKST
jgi:hypothetical protein